jgi:glycosyltransferase involved in cell wall biosynthesis
VQLVSVIIPTYGRPRHLLDAAASVFRQTYRPIELIVVDDASPVPISLESLGVPLADERFHVRLIRHDRNLGPGGARNTGLTQARGSLAVFLDDDDVLADRRIEVGVREIGSSPMHACDVAGVMRPRYDGDRRRDLLAGDTPAAGQVMFRTAHAEAFDPSLRVSEDVDWWARMAPQAIFRWTPERLVTVREQHDERTSVDPLVRAECRRRVVDRHAGSFDRRTQAYQFQRCAAAYLLADEGRQCVHWATRALLARPRLPAAKLALHGLLVTVGLERHRTDPHRSQEIDPRSLEIEIDIDIDTSFVSVVIPVKNMAELLLAQIEALAAQRTERRYEVIVADNGSTDGTRAVAEQLAERHPWLRVVDAPTPGPNAARNVGIAAAHADVIALCDADDVVADVWLEELTKAVSSDSFVAGSVLRGGPNTPEERRLWGETAQTPVVPVSVVAGRPTPVSASCAFPKQMWEVLGGFAEGLGIGGDESEFFVRAGQHGYRCVEAPAAAVRYRLPATVRMVWRRGFNYGSNGWAVRHAAGDGRLLTVNLKQILLLCRAVPGAAVRREGRYVVVHRVAKRAGETSAMTRNWLAHRRRGADST